MRKLTKVTAVVAAGGLLTLVGIALWQALSARVVARAIMPNGLELCVVQQLGSDFPPFSTSIVYRKPGTNWGWFYYDHEDWYWGNARVCMNTTSRVVTIFRKGEPTVEFNWDTERFRLMRPDHSALFNGLQSHLATDWLPGQRIE